MVFQGPNCSTSMIVSGSVSHLELGVAELEMALETVDLVEGVHSLLLPDIEECGVGCLSHGKLWINDD